MVMDMQLLDERTHSTTSITSITQFAGGSPPFQEEDCSGNASSAFLGTSEREAKREGVDMLLLDEKGELMVMDMLLLDERTHSTTSITSITQFAGGSPPFQEEDCQ
ncbi:hypothetical protein DY000_02023044 [Brassica cretica]|uniref:Uncharacterized protein n=1 Tax=Brassica cretica TaxID=69181 RepID=A0ABQ7E8M5_BRACR|nr:hypothetical protein DY000_02023044 [Brassica cretica]